MRATQGLGGAILVVVAVAAGGCGGSNAGDIQTPSGASTPGQTRTPSRTFTPTAPAPAPSTPHTTPLASPGGGTPRETGVVTKVVDGDTIWVDGAGKVRVIGIDTPERGQCGFGPATSNLKGLVLGREVTLSGDGRDDRDRYGRLLRYVDVNGVDAGLAQVEAGLARARYDSRDGYGAHPRESAYIAADQRSPAIC